jgi:hypothetical protein
MNVLPVGSSDGNHAFETLQISIHTASLWDVDIYAYVTYLLNEMTIQSIFIK